MHWENIPQNAFVNVQDIESIRGINLKDAIVPNKTIDRDLKDKEVLKYIDVLVDGPFIEEKKDLNIAFRGSSNQRIIKVQESLNEGSIVLWDEKAER